MKNIRNLVLIIIFIIPISDQSISNVNSTSEGNQKKEKIQNEQSQIDTTLIKQEISHSGQIKVNSDSNNSIWTFIFPSIIALSVGLIALFGTLYSSYRQRILSKTLLDEQLITSQSALEKQIQSSERTIYEQIKSSKEISEQQIISAQKTAELDFRQKVLSVNRQNWINELRDVVSEVISIAEFLALKRKLPDNEFQKLSSLLLKIELMLNPDKDIKFIDSLILLRLTLIEITLGQKEFKDINVLIEEIKNKAKETLKTEWERVKKGE